jgi:cyanophycin synthetase
MHIPNHTLELSLDACQDPGVWPAFDAWLARHFNAAVAAHPGDVPFSGPEHKVAQAGAACATVWRLMQVAMMLQQAARLPVLCAGSILSCRHVPDAAQPWHFKLRVVRLDYLPIPALLSVFQHASRIVRTAAALPGDGKPVHNLFMHLQTNVIEPLQRVMPLGQSTFHVLQAAQARHLPWQHLGNGVFQLGWGNQAVKLRHSTLWNDSAIGTDTVQHKYWSAQWLARSGLPVPEQALADTPEQAAAIFQKLDYPVVIKPVDRDRGEGVSTRVQTLTDLQRAFDAAKKFSSQVLIERKIPGVCHRVLVIRGKVIYVVKRLPIAVRGDGHHTIVQRCAQENALRMTLAPWLRKPPLPADDDAAHVLAAYGYTLDTVLPVDAWAPLRDIESTQWGGIDLDFTDTIHPENILLAQRAAQVFGLESAGVDIISTDIRHPWFSNGAVINEVNSAPSLGAGPSSLRTLPDVLDQLVPGTGRIPVHVILSAQGGLAAARQYRHTVLSAACAGCLLVSKDQVIGPDEQPIHMMADGLSGRVHAALLHPMADAIVLVIHAGEPLPDVIAFDRIVQLLRCDDAGLVSVQTADPDVADPLFDTWIRRLQPMLGPA